MKISTDKRELNILVHYLLKDKVKITNIDAANGIEIEVNPGSLLPAMKFALQPKCGLRPGAVTVRIREFGPASTWLPTVLAKGVGMAASAIGPDVATVLADASGGLITREAKDRIRFNFEAWRRRYHLQFTPVIRRIDLVENRLSLTLEAA